VYDTASIPVAPSRSPRPGTPVRVNGREAVFLYARRNGAVVRYGGERLSRVVSLEKIEAATS
jgi:hypothetical protein